MKSQLPPQYKNIDATPFFRFGGIFSIIAGLCIAINVNLGFRLLRWYYLTKGIL
jgi:hypothetical protein